MVGDTKPRKGTRASRTPFAPALVLLLSLCGCDTAELGRGPDAAHVPDRAFGLPDLVPAPHGPDARPTDAGRPPPDASPPDARPRRQDTSRPDSPLPGRDASRADGPGPPLPRPDAGRLDSPRPGPDAGSAPAPGPGWVVAFQEDFQTAAIPPAAWAADTFPKDGPFSDQGLYFTSQGIKPPAAYRASAALGTKGWLTLEAYSRSRATTLGALAAVVPDPAGIAGNRALRLRSPAHTDAIVLRSTAPLPARYRISVRVGYADFGDGQPGRNGYDSGTETAEPWLLADATRENGFYWLAILDAVPRPHNNVWIHHHRKVVVDSDNHYPPWMEVWNGSAFVSSGSRPVMMFAVDGRGMGTALTGKPFLSYAGGAWQPSGKVCAAESYKPRTWYAVTIERFDDTFTLSVSGDFQHRGQQTYRATLDARAACVWHFNQTPLPASSPCIDTTSYPALGPAHPHWPAAAAWPDYLMLGDPHNNYYEGQVYYDDLRLEVWRP